MEGRKERGRKRNSVDKQHTDSIRVLTNNTIGVLTVEFIAVVEVQCNGQRLLW